MTLQFFNYLGSKRRSWKYIKNIPHLYDFEEYVDPFCGGGSISLNIASKTEGKHFWLNDNSDIVFELWDDLINKDNIEELAEKLFKFSNLQPLTGHSTVTRSGEWRETNHDKQITNIIKRLEKLKIIINKNHFHITKGNYQDEIDKSNNPNTLFILDPPYISFIVRYSCDNFNISKTLILFRDLTKNKNNFLYFNDNEFQKVYDKIMKRDDDGVKVIDYSLQCFLLKKGVKKERKEQCFYYFS